MAVREKITRYFRSSSGNGDDGEGGDRVQNRRGSKMAWKLDRPVPLSTQLAINRHGRQSSCG